MKARVTAAALAALAGGASAAYHRHGHDHVFARRGNQTTEICGCTTIWTTVTGEAVLLPRPTTTAVLTNTTTVVITKSRHQTGAPLPPAVATTAVAVVPTPKSYVLPTPGTYTLEATTITVPQTTTVCGAATTELQAGTHTIGGVTTAVEGATTVTVPVATITTSGTVTTSTIVQTEYVCPSAGTYTIAALTTSVDKETVVVYPTPTSYDPGTYVAPQQVVTATETDFVYFCPFTTAGVPTTLPTSAPTTLAPAPESTVSLPPSPSSAETTDETTPPSDETVETTAETTPPSAVTTVETTAQTTPPSAVTTAQTTPPSAVTTVETTAQTSSATPSPQSQSQSQSQYVPAASSTATPPSPGPKEGGSSTLTSNNDRFGITYTPYQPSNGQCKHGDEVMKDIANLKVAGFTTVRVYSTDCDTLVNVGAACEAHGLKMIVGIFVKASGCSYESPEIKEQVDKLAKWGKWDLVKLLVVGNEAIMNGFCSPIQLKSLITTVKSKCHEYKGPYTISETLNIWQRGDVASEICGVVDVTGANIHPYFNADVTPSSAGDFVAGQLQLLRGICKGNDVINLECGWPTRGKCNGKACPGKTEQADAIRSIREKAGSKTVFFSWENDMWKDAGACGCEQSWGSAASFQLGVGVGVNVGVGGKADVGVGGKVGVGVGVGLGLGVSI